MTEILENIVKPVIESPNHGTAITVPAAVHDSSQIATVTNIVGGLIVVLMIIFLLAYLLKRFNVVPASNHVFKTLAVTSLGPKERLILVSVGDQQYLIGVGAQHVNLIDKLTEPVQIEADSFANRLRRASEKT